MADISASTSIGFSLFLIAVSGSFKSVSCGYADNAFVFAYDAVFDEFIQPAMDDALAGSTKMPSTRASSFCACKDFVVSDGFGCAAEIRGWR